MPDLIASPMPDKKSRALAAATWQNKSRNWLSRPATNNQLPVLEVICDRNAWDEAPPLTGTQQLLFDLSQFPVDDLPAEPGLPPLDRPVWTDNKAHLIMRYLCYFVFITKHGINIQT